MPSLSDHFQRPGFKLRRLRQTDYPTIIVMVNEAFSYHDQRRGQPRTNPKHLSWLDDITEVYVVEQGAELVGCVHVELEDKQLFFGLLTVQPRLRKSGLAPAIIEAIERYAKALGADSVRLGVMDVSPWLVPYYERLGYQLTGQTENWESFDIAYMSKPVAP